METYIPESMIQIYVQQPLKQTNKNFKSPPTPPPKLDRTATHGVKQPRRNKTEERRIQHSSKTPRVEWLI